jgi:hypothetical protein
MGGRYLLHVLKPLLEKKLAELGEIDRVVGHGMIRAPQREAQVLQIAVHFDGEIFTHGAYCRTFPLKLGNFWRKGS